MYKILIAEDDPMVASINKQYTESLNNLSVKEIFSNGSDLLKYLEENSADLIIMDVYMPILDGIETLTKIRKNNIDIDVIMVTAANDSEQIRKLLSLGIVDYLVKPFEEARFIQSLKKFILQKEILSSSTISQTSIDSLLSKDTLSFQDSYTLEKGIQQKTLDSICIYMKNQNRYMTSEEIADTLGLSRVTIRRYMNYLLSIKSVISDIDYTTGGRPSILYKMIT